MVREGAAHPGTPRDTQLTPLPGAQALTQDLFGAEHPRIPQPGQHGASLVLQTQAGALSLLIFAFSLKRRFRACLSPTSR